MLDRHITGFSDYSKELSQMIIDIHTHVFPEKIAASTVKKLEQLSHTRSFSDGSASGLRSSMARAGVDACLVLPVATNPHQVPHVNDSSARMNDLGPETGIYSLGCIHPDFEGYKEELARISSLGLKGIKLHPEYQGTDFDDIRYLRILDRCGELGLFVLSHAGLDIGFPGRDNCSPQMVLRAVRQVGPVKLVLAHMGGWRQWDGVEELLCDTQVSIDTSYALGAISPLDDGHYTPEELPLMSQEQFVRMVRKFGAHRVLFGTDSPWDDQEKALERLRSLPLESRELDAILGGNAQKLLGLGEN